MKIHLNYLGYTVHVKDIATYKDKKYLDKVKMFVEETNEMSCTMWLPHPINPEDVPTVAHEVTHVLQNICKARMMNFNEEVEHMAYLMQFILNKILGYEYWK